MFKTGLSAGKLSSTHAEASHGTETEPAGLLLPAIAGANRSVVRAKRLERACAASLLALSLSLPAAVKAQDEQPAPPSDTTSVESQDSERVRPERRDGRRSGRGQVADRAADGPPRGRDGAAAGDSQIFVTGSRIPRSTFETASPVTVVEAEDLIKSSPSTLAAALNNLPALVAQGGPNATAGQRTAGRNTLNLRGIGADRTLVLLNGRRAPGSSPTGSVDTNTIPQALVTRVEVVTGGASAAYGSDAVAGVVNFILDTRFEGLKLASSIGLSERGDGLEYRGDVTWGAEILPDVNFVVSAEYYKAEGIDGDARGFRRRGANLIPNPQADGTAANPNLIVADMARLADASLGGLITLVRRGRASPASTLIGQQFLPGGAAGPFDFGTNTTTSLQDGGDGVNTAVLQQITRPLERKTIYAGFDVDLSDNVRAYLNGSWGRANSSNATSAFHAGRFGFTVRRDNPFLPETVRQQMVAENLDSLRVQRYDSEYDMVVEVENTNRRAELGFAFNLGNGWALDVAGQIGDNKETARNFNNYVPDLYAQGIDAIEVGGQITCRDPSNGCVPINPFGVGSYSNDMIAFFSDTSVLETRVEQKIAQATLTGRPFGGVGAGPWGIALGAEYRHDDVAVISDPLSEANGFFTNNFQSWEASRSVKEAFAEIDMPLLRGKPGAELLVLNAAIRHTDYTFSGEVTTWKIGANYSPFRDLRLRGSISRDIRAPGLGEMFTAGRSTNRNTYFDPVLQENVAPLTQQQGNPLLVPEAAETIVLGFVYEPGWARGLSVSVDRFDIQMRDALNTLSGQDIIDQCHLEGFAQACEQIIRDADNRIIQVNNTNFNLDDLSLVGWDFELRYRMRMAGGRLTLRAQASLLEELIEQDFQNNAINRVGETTTPEWRALGSINYDRGPLNVFLQGRFIGSNVLNVNWTPVDSAYNEVPAAVYLDAQVGYEIRKNIRLALNIQNLLDKDPVFAPQQDTFLNPTNPNVYDQIGRAYRLSLRAEF